MFTKLSTDSSSAALNYSEESAEDLGLYLIPHSITISKDSLLRKRVQNLIRRNPVGLSTVELQSDRIRFVILLL